MAYLLFFMALLFSTTLLAEGANSPDVSLNILGIFQNGSLLSKERKEFPHGGFSLQEAELRFLSDIDPYWKATALLSISQEDESPSYGIEPEEVFIESLFLPSIRLKFGKMKLALLKQNELHAHALPFIDQSLLQQRLLGDEGLNELGVSAEFLMPVFWYSEIIFQGFSLENEELFNTDDSNDLGGLLKFRNLLELTDDTTLDLGLSYLSGKNSLSKTTEVFGADLTLKWRPSLLGKYQAFIWQTEYLKGQSFDPLEGIATWVQYQMSQRWWLQYRYDALLQNPINNQPLQSRQSVLLGFFPSEFSGFRIQYDLIQVNGKPSTDYNLALQYNVTIGAHPAHTY